jgi:amino acid transporter
MAEETKNAAASAPKGIVMTCIATAVTGVVYIVGLLYACQEKIEEITQAKDQGVIRLFVLVFTNGLDYNKAGAIAMTGMLIINLFFAGFSSMTVTTRIGFAMARDGGFPGSKILYKVSEKNKTPDRIIVLVFLIDVLLCLLPLISKTAFEAITGVSAIGYQISYAIPILLRLTVSKDTFIRSSFDLGRFSLVIGWISVVWLFITSLFFLLPLKFDENLQQTWEDFNYTPAVVGLILIVAMIYWGLSARKFFTGPKRHDLLRKSCLNGPEEENQETLY